MTIINGRSIRETDTADAPKTIIIDVATAAHLWSNQNPLGKLVKADDSDKPVLRQVIGIAASTRDYALDAGPRPSVYLPLSQGSGRSSFLVVKSRASLRDTTRLLQNIVAGVDADQSVFFTETMEQVIADSISTRHFLFLVLTFFALAALALSTLGTYGLVSFLATSRTREMGIRMALGATRADIARLTILQGTQFAFAGTAVGAIGALLMGRLISGLLFEVHAFDAKTFVFAVAVLGTVTTLAAFLPAWRSTRLHPMEALRAE